MLTECKPSLIYVSKGQKGTFIDLFQMIHVVCVSLLPAELQAV